MAYEARQAELMDQRTREEGVKQGLQEGEYNKALEIAKSALQMNLPIEQIMSLTGLSLDEIEAVRDQG